MLAEGKIRPQRQVLAEDCPLLDLIAPIVNRVRINNDSEKEDEGCSDSEPAEFAPDPLVGEGQLFHDGDRAARQFPEFFDCDEALASVYNLDSQEGRETSCRPLELQPRASDTSHPQELMSVALYKAKTKNNVTRDARKDYCRVFLE